MYQPMLYLQWKQTRYVLLLFSVAAYSLPLLAVQGLGSPRGMLTLQAYSIVAGMDAWTPLFPLLAAAVGITLALSSWNWDHQFHHVYALSLPIPRWEYATLKMGAGALLALLPVGAFWIGAHVATASLDLPASLHTYPDALALRFLAATLLSYAVLFAMAAGTIKTTLWVLGGVVGTVVVAGVASSFLAGHYLLFQRLNLLTLMTRSLVALPGPLHIFFGSWALIDV